MDVQHAIDLIGSIIYKPGWSFDAEPFDRFEDSITLRVHYPARNFNADQAPDYPTPVNLAPRFPIMLGACDCDEALFHAITQIIMRIEDHEMREALRVPAADGSWHAPFHPHNYATMTAWSRRAGTPVEADLAFAAV